MLQDRGARVPLHCYSTETDVPGSQMTDRVREHRFASRDEASVACAEHLAALLLVVTGGSSPAACYAELAKKELDWPGVSLVLSDERWVTADDENSNQKLVHDSLLVGPAASASLLPMYAADVALPDRCEQLDEELQRLPLPFAASLLGMGQDGHIASLFPDTDNLAAALDPYGENWSIAVNTAASPHPRISLTMSALLNSKEFVLLFFGDAKYGVWQDALAGAADYPVSALLKQDQVPIQLFWAP
jgi:6-phosphogluconolactonase